MGTLNPGVIALGYDAPVTISLQALKGKEVSIILSQCSRSEYLLLHSVVSPLSFWMNQSQILTKGGALLNGS